MRYLIILVFLLGISAPPSKAAPMTAGNLANQCRYADDQRPAEPTNEIVYETGHCVGYVTGLIESIPLGARVRDGMVHSYAWEDNITVGQVIRVFLQFIKNHPELENKWALIEMLDACESAGILHAITKKVQ